MGVEGLYQTHDAGHFPAGHEREDDFDLAAGAVPVNACDAVVLGLEAFDQRPCVLGGNHAYHHDAEAEPLGDADPDEVARRKACGVGYVAGGIGKFLHDLTDGQKPDQDFHEADDGGDVFHPSRDEDDPDRSQGDVGHAGHENHQRQKKPSIQIRRRHGILHSMTKPKRRTLQITYYIFYF